MAAEAPEQTDPMFPKLDEAQIARLKGFGEQRRAKAGEILFNQGDANHGVFVVLDGSIEIVGVSSDSDPVLRVLGSGLFTGEVNQLSGRRSLVLCRARESSTLLEIGRANLRQIM